MGLSKYLFSLPLTQTQLRKEAKGKFRCVVTIVVQTVGKLPFIGPEQPDTPVLRGELREVTDNVRCPCEVMEIKTLLEVGPVQHR